MSKVKGSDRGAGRASAIKPTLKLLSLAFVLGRVAACEGVMSLLFLPLSVLYLLSELPEKTFLPLSRDQSKLTTLWSSGMASVTLSAGSTGVTSRRVPSCSALSNASVPALCPVTVNESTT